VTPPVALRQTMAGLPSIPVRPHGCAMRLFSTAFGHVVQPFAPHEAVGQPSHGMHIAVPGTMGFGTRKWPGLLQGQKGGGEKACSRRTVAEQARLPSAGGPPGAQHARRSMPAA